MISVLTPLSKVHRGSRKIDSDNFVAAPGIWASLKNDGSLENVATAPAVAKLVLGNASSNSYESHDVTVGRIATLETIGARVKASIDLFDGAVTQGAALTVSAATGKKGLLKAAATTNIVVAVAEEVTSDYVVYTTASPTILA